MTITGLTSDDGILAGMETWPGTRSTYDFVHLPLPQQPILGLHPNNLIQSRLLPKTSHLDTTAGLSFHFYNTVNVRLLAVNTFMSLGSNHMPIIIFKARSNFQKEFSVLYLNFGSLQQGVNTADKHSL